MNRDETLALYRQGKVAWNAWAEKMMAERKTLEEAKEWNKITLEVWQEKASADFSGTIFDNIADFSHFIFPSEANFSFSKIADKTNRNSLQPALFSKDANFDDVTFKGEVNFVEVLFEERASFICTYFEKTARFGKSHYKASAFFLLAHFKKDALFANANFGSLLLFDKVRFKGNAVFANSKFVDFTRFTETTFSKKANFIAINSDGGFTLGKARFGQLPDFRQAHFKEVPSIDSLTINEPPKKDLEAASKYRALKIMAIQGHDHEEELNFFAGELISKGLFAGKLYGWFSDYGRSLLNPFFAWITTVLYAAMGYHYAYLSIQTTTQTGCDKWLSVIELSLRKGLLALGWEKSSKLNQIYNCLYGGTSNAPVIPSSVSLGGLLQTMLSTAFIFLFLLAVRNLFRIK